MKVGGLFSGIGGWELGLERAGMDIAWHCEADPFCRRILELRWPGVPCYPDIRTLTSEMVEPVDVLCGGFPCQDISVAGKGAGIDGSRSGLWSEYARLIGELRPRYVLVENVSALLGRGLERVLGDLAALGYDAEWDCLPASAFGAPHRRDRLWIVAYPDEAHATGDGGTLGGTEEISRTRDAGTAEHLADTAHERHERSRPARDRRAGLEDGSSGSGATMADSAVMLGHGSDDHTGRGRQSAVALPKPRDGDRDARAERGWWATEPDVGRVANGVPARVDRLRSLGNAVVPQIPEWIGRRIMEYEDG